jgi:hypothetical protein
MPNFFQFELERKHGTKATAQDKKRAYEFLHDLVIRGLAMGSYRQLSADIWELTSKGERALTANDILAIDPGGFIARTRSDAAGLDPNVFESFADSVHCLEQHLPRPGSVMLGVAAEVAALQVGDALVAAAAPKEFPKWNREPSAAKRWDRALARDSGYLKRLSGDGTDGDRRRNVRELEERHDVLLTLIRLQRNDAGHAVTPTVDEEVVRAYLVAAPQMFTVLSRVLRLISFIASRHGGEPVD